MSGVCNTIKRSEKFKRYCQECGEELADNEVICHKCGCPIKETGSKIKEKSIEIIKKRTKIILPITAIIIVLIVLCVTLFKHDKNFGKYVDYIGKSHEKLPDNCEKKEVMNGLWMASCEIKKNEEAFAFADGTIRYMYDEKEQEVFEAEAGEIFSMSWDPDYDFITEDDVEDIQKILKEEYGTFDRELKLDNSADAYEYKDDDFVCQRYIWDDENEIYLDIEKEGEEYTSIHVMFRKKPKD